MAGNKSLENAKKRKYDEFYTQLSDIEKELRHYKEYFKDKIIFCNCDDPEASNFWRYFQLNFNVFSLKKLISTHYDKEKPTYKLELTRDINNDGKIDSLDIIKTNLKQNGDFRSPECVEILKEADIVITNPPFSLFIPYLMQLIEYEKKFIIIGNLNAIHYKEIFPLLQSNKVWLGYNYVKEFIKPDGTIQKFGNILWFTNIDTDIRHEEIILYKNYNSEDYPTYINYDAIEVNNISDIPCDYYGKMGVPDSFLQCYNPEQFEIIGLAESYLGLSIGISANLTKEQMKELKDENPSFRRGNPIFREKGGKLKKPYSRIIIKRRVKG